MSGFDFEVDGKSQKSGKSGKSGKSKKSSGKKKKKKVLKKGEADDVAEELKPGNKKGPKKVDEEAGPLLEEPIANEKLDT